jgi:NADH dehydrogenase
VILIAGGTGRLGTALTARLVAAGEEVRVFSRGLTKTAGLPDQIEHVFGDVRNPADVEHAMSGVDTVVSAIQGFVGPGSVSPASVDRDGNLLVIEAAERAGADVVLMSVIGAAPDGRMELSSMKYAAEERLRASRCRWTIIRSDAFTEAWLDILTSTTGRSGRPVVLGRGDNPIGFVSIDDVAELAAKVVLHRNHCGETYQLTGPRGISLTELAGRVATSQRGARHVPRPVLHIAASTIGLAVPKVRRMLEAGLAMDELEPAPDDRETRTRFAPLPRTDLDEVLARRVTA